MSEKERGGEWWSGVCVTERERERERERESERETVFSNGALNHDSKSFILLKMSGNKKFKSDHSSGRLLCSGVPVSNSRLTAMYSPGNRERERVSE